MIKTIDISVCYAIEGTSDNIHPVKVQLGHILTAPEDDVYSVLGPVVASFEDSGTTVDLSGEVIDNHLEITLDLPDYCLCQTHDYQDAFTAASELINEISTALTKAGMIL